MLKQGSRAGMSVRSLNSKWPNARIYALKHETLLYCLEGWCGFGSVFHHQIKRLAIPVMARMLKNGVPSGPHFFARF